MIMFKVNRSHVCSPIKWLVALSMIPFLYSQFVDLSINSEKQIDLTEVEEVGYQVPVKSLCVFFVSFSGFIFRSIYTNISIGRLE